MRFLIWVVFKKHMKLPTVFHQNKSIPSLMSSPGSTARFSRSFTFRIMGVFCRLSMQRTLSFASKVIHRLCTIPLPEPLSRTSSGIKLYGLEVAHLCSYCRFYVHSFVFIPLQIINRSKSHYFSYSSFKITQHLPFFLFLFNIGHLYVIGI